MKTIEEIINKFNFEKVHKFMVAQKWGWGLGNVVPTIGELKVTAQELLVLAKEAKIDSTIVATGGFWAIKSFDDLHLLFAIENS